MKHIADLLGRIFISIVFIYEAVDSILFFEKTIETMKIYGITWQTKSFLVLAIVLLILGGTTVLIGYFARFGAFLLLLYWLPFTLIVYSFWNDPPDLQQLHALMFMRNIALCGGLLLLLSNGSGKYSVKRLLHVMRLPK